MNVFFMLVFGIIGCGDSTPKETPPKEPVKQEDPKLHRFFYNRGRSLDELAYLMMNAYDREDIQH